MDRDGIFSSFSAVTFAFILKAAFGNLASFRRALHGIRKASAGHLHTQKRASSPRVLGPGRGEGCAAGAAEPSPAGDRRKGAAAGEFRAGSQGRGGVRRHQRAVAR